MTRRRGEGGWPECIAPLWRGGRCEEEGGKVWRPSGFGAAMWLWVSSTFIRRFSEGDVRVWKSG